MVYAVDPFRRMPAFEQLASEAAARLPPDLPMRTTLLSDPNQACRVPEPLHSRERWVELEFRCLAGAGLLHSREMPDGRGVLLWYEADAFAASVAAIDLLSGNTAPTKPPDGLEGGRWLWWKGTRYDVPQGTAYRLLDYMWGRDSASYDNLEDEKVFESSVTPQTIRTYTNRANNALPPGFPWRLSTDAVNRQLTKVEGCRHEER
jgi:hypothetical protein